jgi:type IV secretion system protein TrbJ
MNPVSKDIGQIVAKKRVLISIRSGLIGALGLFGLALLLPRPAAAIFGFGDIVFDPTSYATLGHIWGQDISNYAKLIQSVQQLEKIYGNAVQVYDLSRAMSQSFSGGNKRQWIALAQTGLADYTHDKYGENQVWSEAVSGNPSQVPNAWQQSTVALNAGLNLAGQTVGQSPALARLASIEAMDGSSTKCLATVSQYRGNSLANQLGPILKLAIARADGHSDTNGEVQQLNILAAEHEQGNTESRAQGQIDACLVEQQILANKIQRDTFAENLNFQTQYQQYVAAEGPQWGSASQALQSR